MTVYPEIQLSSALAGLPPVTTQKLREEIRDEVKRSEDGPLLVILDDDPTGTQTCHDINILTVWDTERLVTEFNETRAQRRGGFFILTNSRALHPDQAKALMIEICTNLQAASRLTGQLLEVVLRGDSILRGHFPLEPEAVEQVLGPADAWVLCPFFMQGGRYTIEDVHYVQEDDKLIPAAETPFAKDATFGYTSSNLRDYVVEKSKGAIPRDQVTSVSIDMIRTGGVQRVLEFLLAEVENTNSRLVIVINAVADEDIDVVVAALLQATKKGKRFLYRTGAAFVSARLGISSIQPLSAASLGLSGATGGLIIAGSYVPKTTAQLQVLTSKSGDQLTTVVLDVKTMLSAPGEAERKLQVAIDIASAAIVQGQDVLVMTSRDLVTGQDERESLDIGSVIASGLVTFLQRLEQRPRYVIAKGGITSSDMATKGLRMKCAEILGQASPGVPIWRCDEPESKWSGLTYVVFPGNVGSSDALYDVVSRWRQA
ncbi:hypothetical protein B0I35DRAFT_440981 [Stachybotrys elegans]|uniref:Hydroxyacid dehydrogenase n=1 Tax=Stachybotrys elegans TaxID=80388 RepID=A0A8K0WLJ3_9HYPO|nr:hypothetical protein B0I35DRAFT_440981 [Stachybotrys elegans]